MNHNWNTIIEDLGPRLFRYFRARFTQEESSDKVQETLIRLIQKTNEGHFDHKLGNLRMFAYGIAHFVAMEAKKSSHSLTIVEELRNDESLEQKYIDKQNQEKMRQALAQLSPVQVQIISLMIDEELSLNEIAILMNMPLGTVKSHIHRAKEELKNVLNTKESL